MLFLSCLCYAFVRVCLLMPCGPLLGKGWPLVSRLWSLIVKLSLSHWYPVSGVVLDCIDSWSLPTFLLLVLQSSWWGRESWLLYFKFFLISCDCKCSVALPHDAVGWSAVCVCGDHTHLLFWLPWMKMNSKKTSPPMFGLVTFLSRIAASKHGLPLWFTFYLKTMGQTLPRMTTLT